MKKVLRYQGQNEEVLMEARLKWVKGIFTAVYFNRVTKLTHRCGKQVLSKTST